MKCSEVIRFAWRMVNDEPGLVWYGVVPAFFSTLVGVGYLAYQFLAFEISPFFGGKHFNFEKLEALGLDFVSEHTTLTVILVAISAIVGALYFLLPPLCEGGIIGMVAARHRGKSDIQPGDGVAVGVKHFLKMFELELFIGTFGMVYFATVISLMIRKLGMPAWLVGLLIFLFVASFLIGLLFIYAQNFIVLENNNLFQSLMRSAKLVVNNLRKTFLMWLLIFLISIRVIINVILVFLIPAFVAFVANFFVSTIAITIGLILAAIVGLIVLLLAAYLAGILHVFTTTAWTLTFLNLDHDRAEKLLAE